jgi:hypothetical protein
MISLILGGLGLAGTIGIIIAKYCVDDDCVDKELLRDLERILCNPTKIFGPEGDRIRQKLK